MARNTEFATVEGWKQSGVVTKKVWHINPGACPICIPLDGKTVSLTKEYSPNLPSGSTLETKVSAPPAHPNCGCFVLPITITKQQQMINMKKKEDELEKVIQENKDKTDKNIKEIKENAKNVIEKEVGNLRDINKN